MEAAAVAIDGAKAPPLTIPATIAAAVAAAVVVNDMEALAAWLAALAAVLTGLSSALRPESNATSYVFAAKDYRSYRFRVEHYQQLDLPAPNVETAEVDAAKAAVKSLGDELDEIRRQSPYLPRWTWWLARHIERRREKKRNQELERDGRGASPAAK